MQVVYILVYFLGRSELLGLNKVLGSCRYGLAVYFFSTGAVAIVILGGAIPLGLLGVLAGYSLIYNRGPHLVRIIALY